ncbi:MAG: hypothetical protein LBS95_00345 [Mycoplasmataceae bacterium]|jgi:hypothetical protein|nr:hypothetical protein [Mycoplasmataceae bacterium]
MRILTKEEKQNINGGIAPMLLWAIITGSCLAISTISNLVNSATSGEPTSSYPTSTNPNGEMQTYQNYSNSSHSTFLRVSPRITSSAFFLPF